jgi:hypothetical protein
MHPHTHRPNSSSCVWIAPSWQALNRIPPPQTAHAARRFGHTAMQRRALSRSAAQCAVSGIPSLAPPAKPKPKPETKAGRCRQAGRMYVVYVSAALYSSQLLGGIADPLCDRQTTDAGSAECPGAPQVPGALRRGGPGPPIRTWDVGSADKKLPFDLLKQIDRWHNSRSRKTFF